MTLCACKTAENSTGSNKGESGSQVEDISAAEETKLCKVVFDSAGGSFVETQTVEVGEKLVKPTDPTKAEDSKYEYAFEGWYLDDYEWDFETDKVSGNITLTAKWGIAVIYSPSFTPSD